MAVDERRPPAWRDRKTYLFTIAAVALLYLLTAKLGLSLTVAHGNATPLWAPTGISLAAVLLLGYRAWPAIFLGAFSTNVTTPIPLWAALGIGVGNTLEAVVSAVLLRRIGFRPALDRVRDVLGLAAIAAGLGTTISATIGVTTLLGAHAISGTGYGSHWSVWWIGDAMGDLLIAPFILAWATTPRRETNPLRIEWIAILATTAAVASWAFFIGPLAYSYALFPIMIWATLRFRQRGASTAALLTTAIGVWSILSGSRVLGADGTAGVELLQGLMAVSSVACLILAATADEREIAEVALRREKAQAERNEMLLAEAQQLAHFGSWEWDLILDRVTWSDEMYRIYGYPPGEEMTFAKAIEHMDPEDVQLMQRRIEDSMRHGSDHDLPSITYAITRADGERRVLHGGGRVSFEKGQPIRMVGTVQDITGHKRAEEKFRALMEFAPDAVVIVDTKGIIVTVNAQTEKLLGYSRDEILGHPVEVLLPDRLKDTHQAHRSAYAANPQTRPMGAGLPLRARRKNGEELPVDISLSPLHTDEGTLMVAAIRDATERTRVEDTLRRAYEKEREAAEQLRGVDQLKDTFLTAVSHDLRTPLTTVLGMASTLRRHYDDLATDEHLLLLDRMVDNAERLERLLSDLLDLDRLSRGIMKPRRERIDLSTLVRRVLQQIELGDHEVLVEEESIRASVDAAMVERIVENLVTNAVRYSPAGTTIWIRIESRAEGVLLSVEDEGPGVTEEDRHTIFEPFRQGAAAPRHSPGTGIGLSLVARFAQLHGGSAWVDERPAGGAAFRVFLPNEATPRRGIQAAS